MYIYIYPSMFGWHKHCQLALHCEEIHQLFSNGARKDGTVGPVCGSSGGTQRPRSSSVGFLRIATENGHRNSGFTH